MDAERREFFERNCRRRTANSSRYDRYARLPLIPRPRAKLAVKRHFARIGEIGGYGAHSVRIARHEYVSTDIAFVEIEVILSHHHPLHHRITNEAQDADIHFWRSSATPHFYNKSTMTTNPKSRCQSVANDAFLILAMGE